MPTLTRGRWPCRHGRHPASPSRARCSFCVCTSLHKVGELVMPFCCLYLYTHNAQSWEPFYHQAVSSWTVRLAISSSSCGPRMPRSQCSSLLLARLRPQNSCVCVVFYLVACTRSQECTLGEHVSVLFGGSSLSLTSLNDHPPIGQVDDTKRHASYRVFSANKHVFNRCHRTLCLHLVWP